MGSCGTHEVARARELIRDIVGEIEFREKPDGVFAPASINAETDYRVGAQERT